MNKYIDIKRKIEKDLYNPVYANIQNNTTQTFTLLIFISLWTPLRKELLNDDNLKMKIK